MHGKIRSSLFVTGALLLLSILFTFAVCTVDVQPIGPEQSRVGFAALNGYVSSLFGLNLVWYQITDYLGIVAVLLAAGFALMGFTQLIRRKSLWRVDANLLALSVFYMAVLGVYLLFEVLIINYRPVLLGTALEASFPSSHTMLVCCILSTAAVQAFLYLRSRAARAGAAAFCAVVTALTVFGRLLSGVHWFTDLVGGLLFSATLVMAYCSALRVIQGGRQGKH